MSKTAKAVSCFKEGFSCSQAILSTYAQELGLDKDTALKVSGAFGGGMAGMAETCGAVTGAFMVIGLKYGKIRPEDEESKRKAYALVKDFVKRFKAKNSSIVCKELLGCDIGTPEGVKMFKDKNLINTLCSQFVQDAAEIIEQIL
ncbi:MAG: C-GCAxxG-C-C family protein [Candidatus Omnitrophica bacterium]|jgi:C_GCAxxG_C_C family probable redox protein|nr:C-GCAxxG-C-C family protein [Candidatus Omnitrophota bacterium]